MTSHKNGSAKSLALQVEELRHANQELWERIEDYALLAGAPALEPLGEWDRIIRRVLNERDEFAAQLRRMAQARSAAWKDGYDIPADWFRSVARATLAGEAHDDA